jgi:hypothetical protein
MKYTVEDIRQADQEMEELSEAAYELVDKKGGDGMRLLEHLGVSDTELIFYVCGEKGMDPITMGFWCAGFATAMRMVYNKENEVA